MLLRAGVPVWQGLQMRAHLRLLGDAHDLRADEESTSMFLSKGMKPALQAAFAEELRLAGHVADPKQAWRHLERAHVLSQAYAWPHVVVHGHMLIAGFRRGDAREVWGQLVRVLVAAPGSWLGRAPLGNTGGADVGILTPMPIPEDLRRLLEG
jgi:hypothetical protein